MSDCRLTIRGRKVKNNILNFNPHSTIEWKPFELKMHWNLCFYRLDLSVCIFQYQMEAKEPTVLTENSSFQQE